MPAEVQDQQTDATEEQSKDQAGVEESGVQDEAIESSVETTEGEAESIELLGQDVFDKLKDDPATLRKELNRAATKKFQEISSQRKALAPYVDFIEAMEEDPRAAVSALATSLGMKLDVPDKGTSEKKAATITDSIMEKVRESLGPEYEDLADRLAPAMGQVAEMVARAVTRPLEERTEQIISDSSAREAAAAIEVFTKKFPDWKTHEPDMLALSKKLPPGPGMGEQEYLEILYSHVTRDKAVGEGVKKVVQRMNVAAKGGGGKSGGMGQKNVSERPAGPPTFSEAYQAAKRGVRLE